MKRHLKAIWDELISYISKEQCFLIFLYMIFNAYLENTRDAAGRSQGRMTESEGNRGGRAAAEPGENRKDRAIAEFREIRELIQLGERFQGMQDCELKRAVGDFEESIAWEVIAGDKNCQKSVRYLKEQLESFVQTRNNLERVIVFTQEFAADLDGLQFTPESVNRMLTVLPVNEETDSVAELYCGLAGTGLTVYDRLSGDGRQIRMICEEQRKLYCDISRIRMYCHGIDQPDVFCHDILQAKYGMEKIRSGQKPGEPEDRYDLVIADLPKGKNRSVFTSSQERIYTDWLSIQTILDRVSDQGKAMIIVTKGALVRQGERELREALTETDWLEAVITLPANMYATTRLGVELLVINKQKPPKYRGKYFMADISDRALCNTASHEISRETISSLKKAYENLEEYSLISTVVSSEKIREEEYSWNPFLYLRFGKSEEKRNTVELGQIAEIMRGAQITKEEEEIYSKQPTHYWLNIRNIEDGDISFRECSRIRAKAPDWERKFGIQPDDIIITSKGSVLKMCIVAADMPKAFLCGNLTRIRVNQEKYSPYVLYEFLNSEEGRSALDSIQSGTTIKVYNNTNLSRLPVPDYRNARELQERFKQAYQEYRSSVKEIENRFETKRKKLLNELIDTGGMKVKGIFISHSAKNREFVEKLTAFLESGMRIESSKIFCTSLSGTLPTGKDFIEIIKREVRERGAVIALITPEYLQSQFCMMELGAAWAEAQYLCPILADGIEYEDLAASPLKGIQMRKIDREEDLCVIYDELVMQKLAHANTAQFNKKMKEFLKDAEKCTIRKGGLLYPDAEGYYRVMVEKERDVPAPYLCYKIKGRLAIETDDGQDEKESHWIFYETGAFANLKQGDIVRLKVKATKQRRFPDIGLARNIYPDEMHVER